MTGNRRILAALMLALASAWPALACAVADLAASPYERALAVAWCGAAPHAAFAIFGHGPACWAGAALLATAAGLFAAAPALSSSRPIRAA